MVSTCKIVSIVTFCLISVADFSDSATTVTIPANSSPSYRVRKFFTINDDNIDENEESFAIVAEIGQDVPDGISCFQTEVGSDVCFGRRGATEIRIADNDRMFISNRQLSCYKLLSLSASYDHWVHPTHSNSIRRSSAWSGSVPAADQC